MKSYIGAKIIKAEPMDELTFLKTFKGQDEKHGNPPGYHIRYPDGYDSWSPKDVFESAYRLILEAEYDLLESADDSDEKRKEHFRAESVPNEDPD